MIQQIYLFQFVYDFLKGHLPKSYTNTFLRLNDSHSTCTRQAGTGMLSIPRYKSTTFGLKSIFKNCINSWNKFTSEINKINQQKFVNKFKTIDIDLLKLTRNKMKETLTNHMLSNYNS